MICPGSAESILELRLPTSKAVLGMRYSLLPDLRWLPITPVDNIQAWCRWTWVNESESLSCPASLSSSQKLPQNVGPKPPDYPASKNPQLFFHFYAKYSHFETE